MAYTLKSNPTMAAASLVWCASEGLVNLVNAAAVTKVGTLTTQTVNGRATLTSPTQGNYLSAAVAAIAASTDFAILIVQAYGKDIATDTGNMVNTPLAQMNIQSPGFGQQISLNTPYLGGNTAVAGLPSDTFTAQKSPVLIFGRNVAASRYKAIVDGGTPAQSAADGGNNVAAIAAGNWLFCGSLPTGATAYQKTALFAVFIGVTPDDLATYIAGSSGDPFAALFNGTPTTGVPVLSIPTITGVGATTATPGITTDTASGTLYLVNSTTNSAPSAAQVKAGQNAASAAVPSNSQAVASIGAKTANMTGLAAGTTYYPFWVQTNGSGTDSLVTAGTSFTTTAAAATAVTMSGPSSGSVGVASTAFTVGANGTLSGTVTVTPSDGGAGGTFTPTSVGINTGTPTATFTYTPASAGAKTISATNNGGLGNPSNLTYTANAVALLNFQAAGMELGSRTGTGISTFGLENGKSYRYTVHADGLTLGAALITSAAITLDSAGKFPNLSSGSLATGSTYVVVAMRQSDGAAAIFRMVAQ